MRKPSKEIVNFVEKNILTEYEEKLPYKRRHIDYVLRRSVLFANQAEVNIDIAYVVAAFHDIGEAVDRKTHEFIGANLLRGDKRLEKFFSTEQIETMAQAVEDHRASGKTEPRSIYGRIVSSADRTTDVDDYLGLCYNFCLMHGKPSLEEIIDQTYEHLCDKFGENGYAMQKMYFDDPEFDRFKAETISLSKDKEAYKKRLLSVNKKNI
jgi:uncharacterized protein